MHKFFGLLLGVLVTGLSFFDSVHGSEPDNRSFVLMNNGSVFHGVVRPIGEKMEIRLGQGATIQVDSKQVSHVAASKLELYHAQVKSISEREAWQCPHSPAEIAHVHPQKERSFPLYGN